MNVDLLIKLRDLNVDVDVEFAKTQAAKDGLAVAMDARAKFVEAHKAELAELRAQIPGEAKPKRTRADAGKPRGPRKKPALVPVEEEAA